MKKLILLDGENNSYEAELVKKEFEIKIILKNSSYNNFYYTLDYFSFPQYCIYKVKYNSCSNYTLIELKDYRSFKFYTNNDELYKKINFQPKDRTEYFKYAFLYKGKNSKYPIDGWKIYDPLKEFERQGVPYDMDSFRISQINLNYKICDTYPSFLILPSHCDDSCLEKVSSCRSRNRFPLLTFAYTHPYNSNSLNEPKIQTFLFRSSQVYSSNIFIKTDQNEIEYIDALSQIGKDNKGFIFYDCRPYCSAQTNVLKGGGVDNYEQYYNCKGLIFGYIENIHSVRKALEKTVEKIYCGKSSINTGKLSFNDGNNLTNFYEEISDSKWLKYISDIIASMNTVINYILSRVSIIVHCTDGWDRTSQICSLAQIVLDPYFRTFEGFAVLIEKDWVSFGHQFAIRNGCDFRSEKKIEKSPIFIQFLHVIYQIMEQYPNSFEFRENLLLYLSDELYSNKFGTFLFNNEKELNEYNAKEKTVSIWSEIFLNKEKYLNPLYQYMKEPLIIREEVQHLKLWKQFFYRYIKIGLVKEGDEEVNGIKHMENMLLKQKKSVINLMNIIKKNGLENEMENNELYNIYKDYLNP